MPRKMFTKRGNNQVRLHRITLHIFSEDGQVFLKEAGTRSSIKAMEIHMSPTVGNDDSSKQPGHKDKEEKGVQTETQAKE